MSLCNYKRTWALAEGVPAVLNLCRNKPELSSGSYQLRSGKCRGRSVIVEGAPRPPNAPTKEIFHSAASLTCSCE